MYLSKNSIISLFFQMSYLYSEKDFQKQGRIQFISIMKYFLAMDEFAKKFGHSCDTENREDKSNFISYVANVVRLSNPQDAVPFYTKDFFSIYGNSKDFNVGSNFFSTNSVNASKNSENSILFPSRFPPLLECKKRSISVVNEAYDRFANDANYLGGDDNKYALLFLWLNRYSNIAEKSSAYTVFLAQLKEAYSQNVIDSLKWESEAVKKKIDELLTHLDFDDNPNFLKQKDLIFDELNENQVKKVFSLYLVIHCTAQRPDFKPHCVEVCESWLDRRLQNNGIGNLFRYKSSAEYKKEYKRIRQINNFSQINENDQSGRPVTALNHYSDFLEFMPHKDGCSPWQQDLENFAHEKNIQLVVDSSGTRVIILNGCVIALADEVLFACFYNDKFESYREKIELAVKAKDKWHLCRADESIPNKPYNSTKMQEILDSDEDKCLYVELTDESVFENDISELIEVISERKFRQSDSPHAPLQIIYYGVPGCGKSYEVNKEIDGKLVGIQDKEYHKVRCVFHPEYSNADFVGQIYPKIEEKTNEDGSASSVVVYEFKPGPFAEIVRRAYQNPDEPFFLIIEEINRGDAAAIFGESFQLLDRIKVGEPADDSTENIYGEGWSSYGIDSQDINAYIRNQQRKNADKQKGHCPCVKGGCSDTEQEEQLRFYPFVNISSDKLNTTWVHKEGDEEKYEEKTLHFSANTAIRLPPNLSIYATMNTSDQNVITTDNAFQRRFKSRMIRNNLKNAAQYNIKIEGTNVYWGAFRKWVNDKILSTPNISKADDKCLGGWFISTPVEVKDAEGNVTKFKDISREDFAEKVIKYLWDDVFKRNAAAVIFKKGSGNGEFRSLSELIDAFENEIGQSTESFDKVFKLSDDDKKNLIKDINGVSQQANLADEESVEGEAVTDA